MRTTTISGTREHERNGFTFTELLVVVFVLVLLGTLTLLAVSTKNTLAVQQTECSRNLKESTTPVLLYAADTGSLPPDPTSWMKTLSSYNPQAAQLLVCPSAATAPSGTGSTAGNADTMWRWSASGEVWLGSFALNGWLYTGSFAQGFPLNYFKTISSVQKPALTPVLADSIWVDLWPNSTDLPARNLYSGGPLSLSGMPRCTISRHGGVDPASAPRSVPPASPLPGAINIGMADGHVETVRLEKLWTYYWHRNWQPPPVRPP